MNRLITKKTESLNKKYNSATRYTPDCNTGLNSEQVDARIREGLSNGDFSVKNKALLQIIAGNTFTLFNFINIFIAFWIFAVGAYKNLLFIGVVILNTLIGIVQELRAKKAVDKLSIISRAKIHVIRNGETIPLDPDSVVLDDIICFYSGDQVCADSIILQGEVRVSEAMLTGESNPLLKKAGDTLLAGSSILTGSCLAKAERIGALNYAANIVRTAKTVKKQDSPLINSIRSIIKIISVIIFPLGALLFLNHYIIEKETFYNNVTRTSAAVIGMIPEGLVLLTSIALSVSVIRLSRRKIMVQKLYAIENLARVDTVCLDKTGTLTTGDMHVRETIYIGKYKNEQSLCEQSAAMLINSLNDHSGTINALKQKFSSIPPLQDKITRTFPFSSETKWSGAAFEGLGMVIIGAPDIIFKRGLPETVRTGLQKAEPVDRILLLAFIPGFNPEAEEINIQSYADIVPMALFFLSDGIRAGINNVIQYFYEQGLDVKIISGDNPDTAASIAQLAGVKNADKRVDISTAGDEMFDSISEYTVFGRTLPASKQKKIEALQKSGKTVAMIGDGVNDVLALRQADCSISVGEGTEAAKGVSQTVLLESDYTHVPAMIYEGRRVINNIQRAAVLFLTKTFMSVIAAVFMVLFQFSYPFIPIQLTLLNALTVGIPSFFIALQPSTARIEGNFLKNVLRRAIPVSTGIAIGIISLSAFGELLGFSYAQISTICLLYYGTALFELLSKVVKPQTFPQIGLVALLVLVFFIAIAVFPNILSLTRLNLSMAALTLTHLIAFTIFLRLSSSIGVFIKKRRR